MIRWKIRENGVFTKFNTPNPLPRELAQIATLREQGNRAIIRVMVKNRTAFLTTWLGTVTLLFAAGAVDYGGSRLETVVDVLTIASAVGTVATTTFAFRSFWRASSPESAFAVVGLAFSPFIVGGLLALNGTAPNFHFTSIGGLFFYGLLSEITAVTLLASRAFGR